MSKTVDSGKLIVDIKQAARGKRQTAGVLLGIMLSSLASAAEINHPDLPPLAQVERALNESLLVKNANNNMRLEQANQRKLNSGPYEFNLRAGSSQRNIADTGQKLQEWDAALERQIRLPGKADIDRDIGAAGVTKAEYALGDAHHEAGRLLLKLWFNWQRERASAALWQQQASLLDQQALMTQKRVKAGDAPKLELNQAQAAAAQAGVSWHQAQLRTQLAANELTRPFPEITLPEQPVFAIPLAIEHNLAYWETHILDDNHELGIVETQRHIQQLQAQRSLADQIPDPTVGLRYTNEMGGNEKVTGVYLIIPIPGEHRRASAEGIEQQAAIAADQASFVKRRLEGDIYAAYLQAVNNFETWQLAHKAAQSISSNADLTYRAYTLGESSLLDSLTARRMALDSLLAENLAQLDANEAHYRLLLDAHQLWAPDENHAQHP
jgi:outer membrane protein TolC